MAFGFGMTAIAIFATVLAFVALFSLKHVDMLLHKDRFLRLAVVTMGNADVFEDVRNIFNTLSHHYQYRAGVRSRKSAHSVRFHYHSSA